MGLRLIGRGILGSLPILMPSVDPDGHQVFIVLTDARAKLQQRSVCSTTVDILVE